MAYVKGEDRKQITLFPEAIDDYITPDNPVRVIEVFVNSLDGLNSVGTENKLHFQAYNIRKVISILGVEEIVKRLAPV